MSSDCDDGSVDREVVSIVGGGRSLLEPGESRGQRHRKDVPKITAREDYDEHTALAQALAEYMLEIDRSHRGRSIRMARVTIDYPDRESSGDPVFPACSVYGTGPGTFSDLGHVVTSSADEVSPGVYVPAVDWYSETLRVEVECQDSEQRIGVRNMLRSAFRPHDWFAGFRRVMPWYHNALGSYALLTAAHEDSPDLVASGIRLLAFTLQADVQTYETRRLPRLVQVRTPGTPA